MVAPSVLPGRAFKRIDRVSRLLFHWTARDLSLAARTGQLPTFTRISTGAMVDRFGIGRVAVHSQPRFEIVDLDGDGVRETPGLVLEGERTQVVTDPENLANWTLLGTPIRTGGQSDPFGGTGAYLIEDDSAGGDEGVFQTIGFTGDGTKGLAVYMRAATASDSRCWLLDTTAGNATRLQFRVVWGAGAPLVEITSGSGVIYAVQPWIDGWYRILFSVDGIVAANTNVLRLLGSATGNTPVGSTYYFGVNAWNAPFPSSHQGASGGATVRAAEALQYPFGWDPELHLTALARVARPAHADASGALGFTPRFFELSSATPQIRLYFNATARNVEGDILSGPGSDRQTAIPAGAEIRALAQYKSLTTGGQVALDVGAGPTAFAAGASGFAAYGNQVLRVGTGPGAGGELYSLLLELKIAAGLYTLGQMLQLT